MSQATSVSTVVVFDTSAILTWALERPGFERVRAALLDEETAVFLHRQNATEVWYQAHRKGALGAFLRAHPERIASDGRPDLTGLDFDDPAVFDKVAGTALANALLADIEAAGVQVVGDEVLPALWQSAGAIKSQFRRVSLADCFGVALAAELDAPFWTSDRHELTALDGKAARIHFIR